MGNAMEKLGEIVGLNASKSKLLVGQVPDAASGSKITVSATKSSAGRQVNLNDEGVTELAGNLIISLAGKDLFQVPKALTQDMASAAKWYREQMGKLAQMVDKNAPLGVQLKQAEKLQDLVLKAAEHGLADPAMAGSFRDAFLRPGIEGLESKWIQGADGLSGKVLQEKMLTELTAPVDKARRWFEPGACFAAGTLVHTKEGLKPIEQIQVGDWVLSKPENGGEQAYKRVLQTFAHEPERVVRVYYQKPNNKPSTALGTAIPIICTPNHPFWIQEQGWTGVAQIQGYGPGHFHFEDKDGDQIASSNVENIYISDQPHVGWMPLDLTQRTDSKGWLWDYFNNKLVATDVSAIDPVVDIGYSDKEEDLYFKLPVYNLEVEDFHTYYVGEHGIWVHNQNCNGLNFEALNTTKPVALNAQQPNFMSRVELNNWLAANNKTDGVYRLRATTQSQAGLIDKADWPNWLKFEEGVAGRLKSSDQVRWEYAATCWDNTRKELGILGVEGAEMVGGAINFIDRKLAWVKAGKTQEVMDALRRISERLKQNPTDKWTFEFNPGIIKEELIQLVRAKKMLEDIRTGSTDGALQIYKREILPDGSVNQIIDTEAMTLLRSLLDNGRILARNAAEKMVFPQNVLQEGPGLSVDDLDLAHVYLQLNQARQYWLDQGASPTRLDQATFAVADLPQGWAARTEGKQITVDISGAGWGWFVDTSPQDNAEFVPLDATAAPGSAAQGDLRAAPGSLAEEKLDLLTVLIHELGHVLGLPMPQSADGSANSSTGAHAMSQYLNPGERRLPDAIDIAALQAAGLGAYIGNTQVFTGTNGTQVGTTVPSAPQYVTAPNPILTNGQFNTTNGWATQGSVSIATGSATLVETATQQIRLNQVFIVGPQDRFLSFTPSGIALDDAATSYYLHGVSG